EVDAFVGDGLRRGVAVGWRGAEYLVGHEPQQVGGVGRAAVEEIGEGLADDGGRDGGGGGELRVEGRLAAEGEEGDAAIGAGPGQGVERRLPGPAPAEEADDDG